MNIKVIFGGLLILFIAYQSHSFTEDKKIDDMTIIRDKLKALILSKQSGLAPPKLHDLRKMAASFVLHLDRPQVEVPLQTTASQNTDNQGEQNDSSWSRLDTSEGVGLGHTLVRKQGGNIFIHAPHQFSDKLTGEIALSAMQFSKNSDALFLNNQHRNDVDYSRLSESILTQLTQKYIDTTPDAVVVQLHGFERKARQSNRAQQAAFIISSGSKRSLELPRKLSKSLQGLGFKNVLVFGDEAHELGATKNPVRQRMYQMQHTKFLHIEISLEQRKEFIKNPQATALFYRCLDLISENDG